MISKSWLTIFPAVFTNITAKYIAAEKVKDIGFFILLGHIVWISHYDKDKNSDYIDDDNVHRNNTVIILKRIYTT